MRKIFLLVALLFLLTFLGGTLLAQKAVLQTDCGKFECEEKSEHFYGRYGPGSWTDAGAECICQYYTPEDWELTYCALRRPAEEELQMWQNCGVPVLGPLSDSWGWAEDSLPEEPPPEVFSPETYEIHEPADLTQVTFVEHASDPDWSPDGSQIVFSNLIKDRIGIINADGTGLRYLDIGGDANWSPVENKLAVTAWKKEHIPGHEPGPSLYLVDLDTGDITLLVRWAYIAAWSPDGTKIVYGFHHDSTRKYASSIWIMNSDGSEKTRLTTDEDGYCTAPSFSYDGSKIVYVKGYTSFEVGGGEAEPNEIWVMDTDGSNKHMIYAPGDSSSLIFQHAWNKDNKILFMKTWWPQVRLPQVWMINADGSDPKPIVAGSDVFGDPVWDNTGTKVAISSATQPPKVTGINIWTFSYQEPSEKEKVIEEEITEEVEEAPKNIFQKIWEAIINFFKWIFRIK